MTEGFSLNVNGIEPSKKEEFNFKDFPEWYERAWLCFDTQSTDEFREFWRLTIAPGIEQLVKSPGVEK